MDKKKERQRRIAAKRVHVDGRDPYVLAMASLKARAMKDHPSLLGIIDVPSGPVMSMDELLIAADLGDGYSAHLWDDPDEAYAESSYHTFSACMVLVKTPAVIYRSLVFLKRPSELDAETTDGRNIAMLFHELGHVDDFERGINLIPGSNINLVEAEYYAYVHL